MTAASATVDTAIAAHPGRMAGQEKHMIVDPPEEYEYELHLWETATNGLVLTQYQL